MFLNLELNYIVLAHVFNFRTELYCHVLILELD